MKLDIRVVFKVDALVVVVDRHGQRDHRRVLADDVAVHIAFDLLRRRERIGKLELRGLAARMHLVGKNAGAKIHALIADINVGAGNDPVDLLLPLSAEGAAHAVSCQYASSFQNEE